MKFQGFAVTTAVAILTGCGSSSSPSPKSPPAAGPSAAGKPKITQFYASPNAIPKGTKGSLCYGVEGATKLTLDPPIAEVWPALTRCIEIRPEKPVQYTLTATSQNGQTDSRTVEVGSAAAPPRLYDLWVNSLEVKAGEQVKVCFKTENAIDVEATPGQLYKSAGCLTDYPKTTTTYKIAAVGGDNQRDRGTVTVKVR